jgi:hypothetical protein
MPLRPEQLDCGRTLKSTIIPEGKLPDIGIVRDLMNFNDLMTKPPEKPVADSKEDDNTPPPKPKLRPKEVIKENLDRDTENVVVCTYDAEVPLAAAIARVDRGLGAVVIERMVIADGEDSGPILEKVQEIGAEKLGKEPKIFVTEFAEMNNEEAIPSRRVVMVGCLDKFVQVSI